MPELHLLSLSQRESERTKKKRRSKCYVSKTIGRGTRDRVVLMKFHFWEERSFTVFDSPQNLQCYACRKFLTYLPECTVALIITHISSQSNLADGKIYARKHFIINQTNNISSIFRVYLKQFEKIEQYNKRKMKKIISSDLAQLQLGGGR